MNSDEKNSGAHRSENFLDRLYPADVIAVIVIIAGSFLTSRGDGESFGPLMIMVVSFYFGLKSKDPMIKA